MRMNGTVCVCGVLFLCLAPAIAHGDGVAAITRPSEDVTLSFVRAGRIARILVKEGDEVKAEQLLVQQDDVAERVQLDQLKAEAEDTLRVRAAEAQLAQKQVDLQKLEEAFKKKAVSNWDVEHARLEVTMAELSLELAKFQHKQNGLKYEETRIQVERMRLVSPVAGRVEKVFVEPGESADALADVIRVVKIDPLWVEVPVPLEQARALSVGAVAAAEFAEGTARAAEGRVIHVGAVADAASKTLTVRVELPNPAARPAGEHVNVSFPVQRTTPTDK